MIDLRKIPFSYPWILDKAVGTDCKTVLDVGCGSGETMQSISKGKNWIITGVDIHGPTLKSAKKRNIYKKLIQSDLTKLPPEITKNKYDLVFSSQVVEHLEKKKALKLISQCEKLSKKRIVISTTVGFMPFLPLDEVHGGAHDDNPHQEHVSGWEPSEFQNRGYNVHGQGIFFVYKQGYLAHRLPKILQPLLMGISMLLSPVVYFFPKLGTYQVNSKTI